MMIDEVTCSYHTCMQSSAISRHDVPDVYSVPLTSEFDELPTEHVKSCVWIASGTVNCGNGSLLVGSLLSGRHHSCPHQPATAPIRLNIGHLGGRIYFGVSLLS